MQCVKRGRVSVCVCVLVCVTKRKRETDVWRGSEKRENGKREREREREREETRAAVKVSTGNLVRPWSRVTWQVHLRSHFTKKGRKQAREEPDTHIQRKRGRKRWRLPEKDII